MAKKKNFKVGGSVPSPVSALVGLGASTFQTKIALPLPNGSSQEFDFGPWIGLGFDDVLSAMSGVLLQMIAAGTPKPHSMSSIMSSGVLKWVQFLEQRIRSGHQVSMGTIDGPLLDEFADWLASRVKANGELVSKNTARTTHAKLKTVLRALSERKLLPPMATLFSRNPFPQATMLYNRRNYIRPLSDAERDRILEPLALEVSRIYEGTHTSGLRTQLGLCLFAIMLKTGLNPTGLCEMHRDLSKCIFDHPRANRKVLVVFKGRANAEIPVPIEPSESRVVSLDIVRLCERAIEMTKDAASKAADTTLGEWLWVFEMQDGSVRGFSTDELGSVADVFTKKHELIRDDGTRLKMTSQLFRNTKANRAWRATKGNILATARTLGNTAATTERYLDVTAEMQEEHRLAGEVLVTTLSNGGVLSIEKTPHSGCRDTKNGEFAPKNGDVCIDFLSCFRCKSQVIVRDDLHRLFSFYWALLRERASVESKKWKEYFGWICRVIDRDIVPKFDAELVARERLRAREEPHPMWRSKDVLAGLRSVL